MLVSSAGQAWLHAPYSILFGSETATRSSGQPLSLQPQKSQTALLDLRQRLLVSRHATPSSSRMPRGSGDRSNGDTAAVAGRGRDRWGRLPARRTAWPRHPRGRNLRGGLCVRRLCLPMPHARKLHLTEMQLDPTSIKVQLAGESGRSQAGEKRGRRTTLSVTRPPQKTSSASTGSSR